MKIKTKYNIGDKVYYYIEGLNRYAWGKVLSLFVSVGGYNEQIQYSIENRFYDKSYDDFRTSHHDNIRGRGLEERQEDEVFSSPKELKKYLEEQHKDKVERLTEVEMNWTGRIK